MTFKSKPSPGYLDRQEKLKIVDGRQVWANKERSRYFTWDALHGEIEIFDRHGYHLGTLDAVSGKPVKNAVRGRKLNV